MAFAFEKLIVYQKSVTYADAVREFRRETCNGARTSLE